MVVDVESDLAKFSSLNLDTTKASFLAFKLSLELMKTGAFEAV
jgi:hypothetical protein